MKNSYKIKTRMRMEDDVKEYEKCIDEGK